MSAAPEAIDLQQEWPAITFDARGKREEMAEEVRKLEGRWDSAIALDGGTTNTRARLIRHGKIVAVARRSVGARDTLLELPGIRADTNGPSATGRTRLAVAIRSVIEEVSQYEDASGATERIVAAGMLSSDVGLLTVPHVMAPAGIAELARAVRRELIPEIGNVTIHFVPGVRTPVSERPEGWVDADVMRGEECETLGAYVALAKRGQLEPAQKCAFLWPGSHSKLVEVDEWGRITRSHTSLAGELLQAVARHTLLVASLPDTLPDELDRHVTEMAARVVMTQGFGRAAFLVRIAALTNSLGPAERASFLIGAVVADDVAHLSSHPIIAPGLAIWVGGRQPLRSLYAEWLAERHSGPVMALDEGTAESAAAMGALSIAAESELNRQND